MAHSGPKTRMPGDTSSEQGGVESIKLKMLVGNGNCKAEKWERVYVASRVVQIIR